MVEVAIEKVSRLEIIMSQTTEFKISKTRIPGLLEVDVSLVTDSRGWFQEKFNRQKLVALGFPLDFNIAQHNLSFNASKGVTRGFHAEPWDKYISVVQGKIFAVFVDLRKENFGEKLILDMDNTKAVFIPAGVANSFQTLEDNTFYTYLVTGYWSAESSKNYKFFNLGDPDVAVDWPIPLSEAVISGKDKTHPMLKEVRPF